MQAPTANERVAALHAAAADMRKTHGRFLLPKSPVLGWSSFSRCPGLDLPSVDHLASSQFTTSGRAALFHALHQLGLKPGDTVLVPTYHCPTIVAPVLCAGMLPRFFAIGPEGLPDTSSIDLSVGARPGAIIAAHYFGLPRSMQALRQWCDANGIPLIEDCAHSYFGQAGEHQVGGWGDFATASASKFFPVPEAGVLASRRRSVAPLALRRRNMREQVKGLVDVVELGTRHGRFGPLNPALSGMFRWKNRHRTTPVAGTIDAAPEDEATLMRGCDMDRIDRCPLAVSMQIVRHLPRQRIIECRRANYAQYFGRFRDAIGAQPLFGDLPPLAAPYVFPLWVDDADRVYHALRTLSAPAFRWDHVWPTTPSLEGDHGALWNRHVIQLLCHQDLDAAHIDLVATAILDLLKPSDARPARLSNP
jgi:perosamine synthetase